VIIDKHNAFTGRIIGINERGDVKFTYSGTESGTKKKYFLPTDIKCTKTGEIIISIIVKDVIKICPFCFPLVGGLVPIHNWSFESIARLLGCKIFTSNVDMFCKNVPFLSRMCKE
jgi:hypothetical protein